MSTVRLRIAIVSIAFVFALGCVGLPSPSASNDTLVILPINVDRRLSDATFGSYAIRIDGMAGTRFSEEVLLSPGEDFKMIQGLPEGAYKISQVRFVYGADMSPGPSDAAHIGFSTAAGQITVINTQFQFIVTLHGGRTAMTYSWPLLTQTKAEQIMARLRKDKNFSLWALSEATRSIPEISRILESE